MEYTKCREVQFNLTNYSWVNNIRHDNAEKSVPQQNKYFDITKKRPKQNKPF